MFLAITDFRLESLLNSETIIACYKSHYDEFQPIIPCASYVSRVVSVHFQKRVLRLAPVVVAQLVERSPPIKQIRSSNPVTGKLLSNNLFSVT